ncbi:DNA-dependent metalloprotease SPRTN [Pholidichthys leucotaenia]
MADEDFLLAIQLQEQFDNEYQASVFPPTSFEYDNFGHSSKKRKVGIASGGGDLVPYWKPSPHPERPLSIVDESWEMLDPNPDIRAMFLEFNDMFFWGKLGGVEVRWSPRMTLCAGLCCYEGRGGLCSIRLSEPLLKLRPRKDLVETLLHEMIHALLFVTQNNRDREGHGPEFCKHMDRINRASGTKITVYHSFHDEVDLYRQHWWRCDGPCQNRRPYFGYVKRAMNRAPSSLDPWWNDHKMTCGGTFTKVKEPEGYGRKGTRHENKDGKTSEKKTSVSSKFSSTATGSGSQDIRNLIPFSGKGFVLGGNSQNTSSSPPHKALDHVGKTPLSSPVSSHKELFTPLSPANGHTNRISVRPATSTGKNPPIKRSVSNTRVFVNITGSPVKIPKSHRSQGSDNSKQKSIEDLFRKSTNQSSASNRDSVSSPTSSPDTASSSFSKQWNNQLTSSPSNSNPSHSNYPPVASTGFQSRTTNPTLSKFFSHSNGNGSSAAADEGQTLRKRPWGDRSSSSSIANFFQKTSTSESAVSRESMKAESPSVHPMTTTVTAMSSTATSLQSSSSFSLTVSCPICQTNVQGSKINEHLDLCLS